VDGATAYVGDQAGHVVAVAIEDGSIVWTAQVPGRVDAPVAVAGDRVYAVARDSTAGQATVVALDATSGERIWAVVPQATSTAASAPSAGDGSVLVGAADRLMRSLAAGDGAERWASLVLSFFSPATAPAFADGAVYAADLSGGLYRFDPADGDRDWSFQLNEVVVRSAPVVSGPTILLGLNDGRLVAIDSETGHLVWESEATPAGGDRAGPRIVKGGKGRFPALDLASPTERRWARPLPVRLAATIVLMVALIRVALRRRISPADLSGGRRTGRIWRWTRWREPDERKRRSSR
jgi:outer membrane protein assembly factor BamB